MKLLAFMISSLALGILPSIAVADDIARSLDNADPAHVSLLASQVVSEAEIGSIGARGAAQVSQLADQAQLKLSRILIKQNEEIIVLLRKLANQRP